MKRSGTMTQRMTMKHRNNLRQPSGTARATGMVAGAGALTLCAWLIAWLITGTLSSCQHKELCLPSSPTARVQVVFDWSTASGGPAEGMTAFFFPEQGGEPLRYDFGNPEGGTVNIPWGYYRVIYLNNDTETLLLRGTESYDTFEVYTRTTSVGETMSTRTEPLGANPENAPVVMAPEQLWGGSRKGVYFVASEAASYTLTLPVYSKTSVYSIEVKGVENLKYVSSVGASFSGLSGSLFPGDDRPSSGRSVVPFPADSDGKSTITGSTLVFGLSGSADTSRVLTLYLILADGSKYYYRFDVSEQVNNAPDKRHIRIVLEGLPLPKPIVNGGGFHPSVDKWDTEEVNLSV